MMRERGGVNDEGGEGLMMRERGGVNDEGERRG